MVDADGAPIENAEVYVGQAERGSGGPANELRHYQVPTRTDTNGRFEVGDIRSAKIHLGVTKRGFIAHARRNLGPGFALTNAIAITVGC